MIGSGDKPDTIIISNDASELSLAIALVEYYRRKMHDNDPNNNSDQPISPRLARAFGILIAIQAIAGSKEPDELLNFTYQYISHFDQMNEASAESTLNIIKFFQSNPDASIRALLPTILSFYLSGNDKGIINLLELNKPGFYSQLVIYIQNNLLRYLVIRYISSGGYLFNNSISLPYPDSLLIRSCQFSGRYHPLLEIKQVGELRTLLLGDGVFEFYSGNEESEKPYNQFFSRFLLYIASNLQDGRDISSYLNEYLAECPEASTQKPDVNQQETQDLCSFANRLRNTLGIK